MAEPLCIFAVASRRHLMCRQLLLSFMHRALMASFLVAFYCDHQDVRTRPRRSAGRANFAFRSQTGDCVCAGSAAAADPAPAVDDAGPPGPAPIGVAAQQDAGPGAAPPQQGGAARQRPPAGPVVPGRARWPPRGCDPPMVPQDVSCILNLMMRLARGWAGGQTSQVQSAGLAVTVVSSMF